MDITEFLSREISQNYKVSGKLGAGGCSIVYDAIRISDNKRVAIKLLSLPETLSSEEKDVAKRRFCREALLMVILHNPHVVECLDYGVFEGSPCIVLDFIHGKPLDIYVREFGALPFKLSVNIICQLLEALECAHAAGVVHRDIKPGNILLTGEGDIPIVHLIDFGIASMTEGPETDRMSTKMGSIRGTPSYMAPELFTGFATASPVSDLYAVGLVLLECLTGTVAVNGVTMMEIAFKQTHQELTIPLFIPKCLANVILKSCAKLPDMRYQSAREMSDALKAALPEAEAKKESYEMAYLSGVTDVVVDEDLNATGSSKSAAAPEEKKSNAKIIAIVIGALVAIGIAIAVIVIMTSSAHDETTTPPPVQDTTASQDPIIDSEPTAVQQPTDTVPDNAAANESNNVEDTQNAAVEPEPVEPVPSQDSDTPPEQVEGSDLAAAEGQPSIETQPEVVPEAPAPQQNPVRQPPKSNTKGKTPKKQKPAEEQPQQQDTNTNKKSTNTTVIPTGLI